MRIPFDIEIYIVDLGQHTKPLKMYIYIICQLKQLYILCHMEKKCLWKI